MAVHLSYPQSTALLKTESSVGVVAGYGSGKTFTAIQKALRLLNEFPGVPVAYAAPTYDLIRTIWYPAFELFCEEYGFDCEINKSQNIITVNGLGTIICRSLSNPAKLVGWECGSAILDEFDLLPTQTAIEGWKKIKARCRSKYPKFKRKRDVERFGKKRHPNQIFAISTPEGFRAFHELFVENPLKNSALVTMSTFDNEHNLPDGYIEELYNNYPPEAVKAYIEGQFVNLKSGSVYPNFDRVLNDASNVFIKGKEPLFVGMDFNVYNMSAIIHVLRNGLPVAVDELVKIKDTPNMIFSLKGLYGDNPIVIYPDASGDNSNPINASLSDIKLLKAAGFLVRAKKKNPFIRDRVNSMNAMFCNALGQRRYRINTKKCPTYVKCLERQIYDKNGLPDKQSDFDHLPDAGGYYIDNEFGIAKPNSQQRKIIM